MEDRAFPSRVDRFIGASLVMLVVMIPVSVALGIWHLSRSPADAVWFFASAAFIAALMVLLVWPVRYTLAADELVIRFGVVRVRIRYDDIEEVTPSRSLLGAPALSLDRLMIRHRRGLGMISPADKAGFLAELRERTGLIARGDGLARR